MGKQYHPFLDGLRAVAIVSVVLYHAGFTFIPGGFVGVDVFFVISGFLIISQIGAGINAGTFSLADFWSRRALRIVPPYLLVVLATVGASLLVMVFADEFRLFGAEVAYSGAMASNFLYLGQEGYFNSSRDTKVLLHLWSLAVEEQFYLLAPLVMFAASWFLKRGIVVVGVIFFATSFAASVIWTRPPDTINLAFYLMPLRAWEFMAGGAVGALVPYLRQLDRRLLHLVCIAGLAAIFLAVISYDQQMMFPSYAVTLPVAGTVMVMAAGLADPNGAVARLLSSRPLVFVGLVSYAWYLWHWPLMTFARIYEFGDRNLTTGIVMALASFLLAIATRYMLEVPVKAWRGRRALGWRPAFACVLACACTVLIGNLLMAYPVDRSLLVSAEPVAIDGCDLAQEEYSCNNQPSPSGLLAGDSQVMSAAGLLQQRFRQNGVGLSVLGSPWCAPILTAKVFIRDEDQASKCTAAKARTLEVLGSDVSNFEFAILFARWPVYTNTLRANALGHIGDIAPPKDQKTVFVEEMRATIKLLRSAGVQRILIVGPTPEFDRHVQKCLARANAFGRPRELCSAARSAVETRRSIVVSRLKEAVDAIDGVRYADPIEAFCDDDWCTPYSERGALFKDTNHVSNAGVYQMLDALADDFNWAAGREIN